MYSTNDWRSYELAHSLFGSSNKPKWEWPNGKNSSAYNKWYYQAHRAYILARAKARAKAWRALRLLKQGKANAVMGARHLGYQAGRLVGSVTGETQRADFSRAKTDLELAYKKAVKQYGSDYMKDPNYRKALTKYNEAKDAYNKSLKGMSENAKASNEARSKAKYRQRQEFINDITGASAKQRLNNANAQLDYANRRFNKAANAAKGQYGPKNSDSSKAYASDLAYLRRSEALQQQAQKAYDRTLMGMADNLQIKIKNIPTTFKNTLNKYLPKKKK